MMVMIPIVVTLVGIVIDVSPQQLLKALVPNNNDDDNINAYAVHGRVI